MDESGTTLNIQLRTCPRRQSLSISITCLYLVLFISVSQASDLSDAGLDCISILINDRFILAWTFQNHLFPSSNPLMTDIIRVSPEGYQEVRTGLGWRRVQSPSGGEATSSLPVIDIGDMRHPDLEHRRAVAKQICDAAIRSGFFYIRNHGVPDEVVDSIFSQTKRFFHDLTLEEKMEYDTEKHEHYYGYYPIKLDPSLPAGASESFRALPRYELVD